MSGLQLYRVVPRRTRRWLFARVPQPMKLKVARRLVQLRQEGRSRYVRGQWFVRDHGQLLPAVRSDDTTPVDAIRQNLDAVARVLNATGVPHFRIRSRDVLKSVFVVSRGNRTEVVKELRKSLPGFTIRWVSPQSRLTKQGESNATILQVFRPVTAGHASMILGSRYACEIEFWLEKDGLLHAPRPNEVSATLPAEYEPVTAEDDVFGQFRSGTGNAKRYRTRREAAQPAADLVPFPVDAVYTWVDGGDPDWLARKTAALSSWHERGSLNSQAASQARYISRDELRYSLRSLVYFAPWIRHIYLVTDNQLPPWLDAEHPSITVVRHEEIFGNTGVLPTFNSHAIESRLNRIPGLSEHFLYVNDDMFFGRPTLPNTFFHANGLAKHFLSPATIGAGRATKHDTPVTAAAKNNRALIESRHGKVIMRKMKHVPYPLRHSVLDEIEATYPDQVLATASHQFRHPEDLSIPSSLHHYWAFMTGRSVPASINYTYVDVGDPLAPATLRTLLMSRKYDAFCLNDTEDKSVPYEEQVAMITEFLQKYFPFRAPFELAPYLEEERSHFSATKLAATYLPAHSQPVYLG